MSIAEITEVSGHSVHLPDTAHAMWERDELRDFLRIPHDRSKIEIIGGRIVVSPAPRGGHAGIAKSLEKAIIRAHSADPEFPWDYESNFRLNRPETGEGFCPDLMVMRTEVASALEVGDDPYAYPDHVEMVVEIASPSNAGDDREPAKRRRLPTKWTAYAQVEIPYYLLIDRDPKAPSITLYSVPESATGAYLHKDTWKFGETVVLEHFGIELDTTNWTPWKD